MSEHTPGVWRMERSWTGSCIEIAVPVGEDEQDLIAQCCSKWLRDGDRLEANARLIASAPKLLQAVYVGLNALRDVVRQLPTDEKLADYQLDFAEMAEIEMLAAIAKASGQETPA